MPSHESQAVTSPAQLSPHTNTPQTQELIQSSYTPIPNVLLDEVMPTLSGSEWQLLCVILRQTQGWHDPVTGRRKTSDWLSHKQLKARTGRGSDAICHAIESLVRKGHIKVKDEKGTLLSTAHERRRSGSRLFYGLGLALLSHFEPPASFASTPVRESRIGKAETTKETPTKIPGKAFGKPQTSFVSHSSNVPPFKTIKSEGCGCLSRSQANPQITAPATHDRVPPCKYSREVSHIVAAYKDLTQNQQALNASFSTSLSQEYVERLEKALSRYGEEQLLTLLKAFFQSDFSLMKRNSSLASFVDSVHILAARRPQNQFEKSQARPAFGRANVPKRRPRRIFGPP